MRFPLPIQKLISLFARWPTVGPKTAERYAFFLLKQPPEYINELAKTIADLPSQIAVCEECQAFSISNPCAICSDSRRQNNLICVVSETKDMLAIEETGQYFGIYHILNNSLDIIQGSGLNEQNIHLLLKRIKEKGVEEVILALDQDQAGQAICLYLTKILKQCNVVITRLAQGLPSGASLEYADIGTLANALKFRNQIK